MNLLYLIQKYFVYSDSKLLGYNGYTHNNIFKTFIELFYTISYLYKNRVLWQVIGINSKVINNNK